MGKKLRIKMKFLHDFKEKAGLGVRDWQLYYRACVLVWLREWIVLEDQKLLKLGGNDLLLGWHAYVWCEKAK